MASGGSGEESAKYVLTAAKDLHVLVEELVDVAPKWRPFGLQLGVSPSFLAGLRRKDDQLFDVLMEWLPNAVPPRPPATWATIVAALQSKSVGEPRLAETLKNKYIMPAGVPHLQCDVKAVLQHRSQSLPEASHTPTTAVDRSHSDDTNASTIERHSASAVSGTTFDVEQRWSHLGQEDSDEPCASPMSSVSVDSGRPTQQPHAHSAVKRKPRHKSYGCGCGNCSLETYLKGECPNPVETASKLPYLNTKEMRKHEIESLIGRLEEESTEMVFRFQSLVNATQHSFSDQNISALTMTSHLKSLGTLKCVLSSMSRSSETAYFRYRFQEMDDAQSIDKIFSITQEYMSFINPEILKHLIEQLGTDNDKENLQRYQQQLEAYCKRRVVECPCEFADTSDGARVVIKKDDQLEQFTLTELRNFRSRLSKILQLAEHTLLLCAVEEGCLQMTFHVPSFVPENLFPLSREQEAQLQQVGVLQLSSGDYKYLSEAEKPESTEAKPSKRHNPRRCTEYSLLGSCSLGDTCRYLHDYHVERPFVDYLQIPDNMPLLRAHKLMSKQTDLTRALRCTTQETDRAGKREVKVLAANEEDLKAASEKLRLIMAKTFPLSPYWTFFHTDSVKSDTLFLFHEYSGPSPLNVVSPVYELSKVSEGALSVEGECTMASKLQMDPDLEAIMASALDTLHGTSSEPPRYSVDEVARAMKLCGNARFSAKFRAEIQQRLKEALTWCLDNRKPGQIIKLEARFGKKIWYNLSQTEEFFEKPMSVHKLNEFLLSDADFSVMFNTCVTSEGASNLSTSLGADSRSEQETFDLHFTTMSQGEQGVKVFLRVKATCDGQTECLVARKNYINVVVCDLLCLHRRHDVRFSLSQYEVVNPKDPLFDLVQEVLQTISFPEQGTMTFVPTGDRWAVGFIRHRNSIAYQFERRYVVINTTITEYGVKAADGLSGQVLTIRCDDFVREHTEVEFHNVAWDSSFGRDVGWTPEVALSTYMDSPCITSDITASIPYPWEPKNILEGLPELIEKVDQISEVLGAAQ